jgi:predicted nucleic acid-binding protein
VADLLVDTDVFVDHLRGARELTVGRNRLFYSVVTRCELFAGRSADETVISVMLGALTELEVERAVAEQAGRLRRHLGMRIPDALIAATALQHGLALWTGSVRDFAPVPGLKMATRARGRA